MMDQRRARRYAQNQGLPLTGCVGILEDLYQQGDLSDLRGAYQELPCQNSACYNYWS
jgi:predicted nucleic acid-binding protein